VAPHRKIVAFLNSALVAFVKLINHRVGWSVEGRFIGFIKTGVVPTDDEMLAYYHLRPGDARFADHACKFKYTRCVLLKHNGNFVITSITPDITEVTQ
jgi:hypothetical protein